jgi:hypothetical protein
MNLPALPSWAEDVFRRWGPQPAWGRTTADSDRLQAYAAMIERFRLRWRLELAPDVWSLFGAVGDTITHVEQARILLGVMVDLARYGSRTELTEKRTALDDVGRLEDEIREHLTAVCQKLAQRDALLQSQLIDGGLDDEKVVALRAAAESVAGQSWREPRPLSSDYQEAVSSRKAARDALVLMLFRLDQIEAAISPVVLTDRARAAIFNVSHDVAAVEHYDSAAVKKARADLRRR